MWNARLDEVQAGIKIEGRNINNLRYADDATLVAETNPILYSNYPPIKNEQLRETEKMDHRVKSGCIDW